MNSRTLFCRSAPIVLLMILYGWPDMGSVQAQSEIVHSIQERLKAETSDSAKLEMHLELTMQFEYLEPHEVKEHVAAAVTLAEKLNEPTKAIRAQYQLAVAQYLSGDFALAETTLREVESKSNFTNEEKSQLDIYNLMGTILTTRNKVREGLSYQFRALELSKSIPDTSRMITALSNIATTYKSNLDTSRCMRYYLDALRLAVSTKDTISRAVINNNLSEIMVDPDSMLLYAHEALSAFLYLDYKDGIAHSSNQYGVGLMAKKTFSKAIPFFLTALDIWTPNSYSPGIASVTTNLASCYGYLGLGDSSTHYAALAERTGLDLEDKTILAESYQKIAEMYESVGKNGLALLHLKKAFDLQSILYSNERAEQFAKAETGFKTREKDLELIEKELTITRQQSAKKNYLIILALVFFLSMASIQYLLLRQRFKTKVDDLEIQKQKLAAEKLRELDRLKSRFFTDISHEFRTPLTLIQTPLRQAIEKANESSPVIMSHHLAYQMHKSSTDLLSLVNQLLDLAKLEDGRMQLEISNTDLAQFIRATAYSFESLAKSKKINLMVDVEESSVDTWFDQDKLFHILSNLLSNAFKFTASRGQVTLTSNIINGNTVQIAVHDTGRGISEELMPFIFDRFASQSSENKSERSTGIGLALTSEMVKLHRGTIEVESTSEIGTIFTVSLPITKSALPNAVITHNLSGSPIELNPIQVHSYPSQDVKDLGKQAPTVLLVEDNDELLQFTKEILSQVFIVDTASNGRLGLERAKATIPDLIITDVLMPELDGFGFAKEIRESPQTSHIPIIMLTAKADQLDKIQGLQTGVDDYLTKPFDTSELLVRSRNLINQRRNLLKQFRSKAIIQPLQIPSTSVDEVFLKQVLHTIENEMSNSKFGVEDLSKSVAFSRSQLHRKLKALTDKSPNEIIRNFRLQRAQELLRGKAGTASEIAYQVGFNSLPYFSKCYKDHFGISPSEV